MYTIKDYDPPKPFWKMSISELVKYNNRCTKIDKYLIFKTKKMKKHRRTKNRKNRKTKRKRRTRKILSKREKLKVIN
jgi:hypothetical protein|tara:strand:- start:171 stop:401 length:231 start_codon:yes stop_codon:yes gene_type:complete